MKRRSFLQAVIAFFTLPLAKLGATKPVIGNLGQREWIGAKFWCGSFIQNEGWVAIIESDEDNDLTGEQYA